MGAEVIILANPYTYNFIKGLTHSALLHWIGHSLWSHFNTLLYNNKIWEKSDKFGTW